MENCENESPRSRKKSQGEKIIFPHKLWRLVNDRRLESAIRWTPDGQSIEIDQAELGSMCLGKENHWFSSRRPKSFIRQLHLYGFKKVDKNKFVHPHFRRDQPELMNFIKRTYKMRDKNRKQEDQDDSDDYQSTFRVMDPQFVDHQFVDNKSVDQKLADDKLIDQELVDDKSVEYSTLTNVTTNLDGSVVVSNNYEEFSIPSLSWPFDSSQIDMNYNYTNDDSILTLYNNDIYPNNCDDNDIIM